MDLVVARSPAATLEVVSGLALSLAQFDQLGLDLGDRRSFLAP
jgi:hypothetical protein